MQHLEDLVKKNHPENRRLFGKLLLFLTDLRSYTASFDFHTEGILKNFKYALPLPLEIVHMLSGEGLAYEPSEPRGNDAPPARRVKELLLGHPVDTQMNETSDCCLDVDLVGMFN